MPCKQRKKYVYGCPARAWEGGIRLAECLEVRWRDARAWLESVRAASARIEPITREIAALEAAREHVQPWSCSGSGSGGGALAHSDPTAVEAERRMGELDALIGDARARLDEAADAAGECLAALGRMSAALTPAHSGALELYYVDRAPTWSDVAREMDIGRTRLWQLRDEAYPWIEANCRRFLS